MSKHPHISQAEWKVMKVLWARPALTSTEVVAALAKQESWRPTTVKTLLSRLDKKHALRRQRKKKRYLFYPIISEADCVELEAESFLQKVFSGEVKPLLLYYLENRRLSPEARHALKQALKKQKI